MENYEKYDKYLRYAMFAAYIANILVRKRQIAIYIVILVSFIIGMLSLILSENLTSDAALIATGVSYVAYGVANGAFWLYIIDNVRFKY
jgi:ABC-type uncharacterized transport system permease subunit